MSSTVSFFFKSFCLISILLFFEVWKTVLRRNSDFQLFNTKPPRFFCFVPQSRGRYVAPAGARCWRTSETSRSPCGGSAALWLTSAPGSQYASREARTGAERYVRTNERMLPKPNRFSLRRLLTWLHAHLDT